MKKLVVTAIIGLILCTSVTPLVVLAEGEIEYQLLSPIPLNGAGSGETQSTTPGNYISGIFMLMIAIAGGLATLKIIFAGIKYMSTDAFSGKEEAKKDIEDALWGFGLAIGAWLILNTINPNLVNFNLEIPGLRVGSEFDSDLGSTVILVGTAEELGCVNCEEVTLNHKTAPNGCAAPGPCHINIGLQTQMNYLKQRLDRLDTPLPFIITESFPPTRIHQSTCQQAYREDSGLCLDMGLDPRSLQTPENIKEVISAASAQRLRAVFEVPTLERAQTIRQIGNLNEDQVIVVPGITGEHFSIYLKY